MAASVSIVSSSANGEKGIRTGATTPPTHGGLDDHRRITHRASSGVYNHRHHHWLVWGGGVSDLRATGQGELRVPVARSGAASHRVYLGAGLAADRARVCPGWLLRG